MLMVIAIIFGAHLLPFSWLYKSKSYMVFAILIPILALLLGIYFTPYLLAMVMVGVEILFSLCLAVENKTLRI
jgi:fumarate reductase subunit D